MNWRRFAWILIIILILSIVWAYVELKNIYANINSAKAGKADDLDKKLLNLQKSIEERKETKNNLEKYALWPPDVDIMSWLTQHADDSDVKIIGVEHPPSENIAEYRRIPIKITLRGNYNPMGRFINKLERSSNAVKIDSFRIAQKEYEPEYITMDLFLSYFQKV